MERFLADLGRLSSDDVGRLRTSLVVPMLPSELTVPESRLLARAAIADTMTNGWRYLEQALEVLEGIGLDFETSPTIGVSLEVSLDANDTAWVEPRGGDADDDRSGVVASLDLAPRANRRSLDADLMALVLDTATARLVDDLVAPRFLRPLTADWDRAITSRAHPGFNLDQVGPVCELLADIRGLTRDLGLAVSSAESTQQAIPAARVLMQGSLESAVRWILDAELESATDLLLLEARLAIPQLGLGSLTFDRLIAAIDKAVIGSVASQGDLDPWVVATLRDPWVRGHLRPHLHVSDPSESQELG